MTLPIVITPMELNDVPEIAALEVRCFPTPWSARAYQLELQTNSRGHYWVVRPVGAWASRPPAILAYGGYWALGDEAHIVTLATHPKWRRFKLGALLLLHLVDEAARGGIVSVTLEVRESNVAAQRLYLGLGFVEVGRRRGYYPATPTQPGEDALLLTLDGIDLPGVQAELATRRRDAEARIRTQLAPR